MLAIDFGTSEVRAVQVSATSVAPADLGDDGRIAAAVGLAGAAGERPLGEAASRLAAISPDQVAVGIKRLVGQAYDEPHVRGLSRRFASRLVAGAGGEVAFSFDGAQTSPTVAAAHLFRAVADSSDDRRCMVAVPACFDMRQRSALAQALRCGGLEVQRIYPEAVAAAIGSGIGDGCFLVCDIGAGIAEFAIIERQGRYIEVLGAAADVGWGGDDLDLAIAQYVIDRLPARDRSALSGDAHAMSRLRSEARQIKESCATVDEQSLYVPMLRERIDGTALDIDCEISAGQIAEAVDGLLRRLELPFHEAFAAAGRVSEDLDGVVLCGGSVKLEAAAARLKMLAGPDSRYLELVDGAVLRGLGLFARAWEQKEPVVVVDRLGTTLALAEGDFFAPVLGRGARLPTRAEKILATRTDNQREILFSLFQGESSNIGHSRMIGQYVCTGMSERPAGDSCVVLVITVDENGAVLLDARELVGGAPVEVRRVAGPGLTRAEADAVRAELG